MGKTVLPSQKVILSINDSHKSIVCSRKKFISIYLDIYINCDIFRLNIIISEG